jgi:hypothetical protein
MQVARRRVCGVWSIHVIERTCQNTPTEASGCIDRRRPNAQGSKSNQLDRYLRIALKNSAWSRRRSLILFSLEQEIRPMMGERRVMQEALFYGFSLERHVPDNHLLRKIDRFVDLSEVRRHLEPY